ncbi:MAG TPA: ABC transporter permease [Candidatus Angelobacter sp.]|nr:ABC transporter permease [Candidatus Angelobacter sp.]
MFTSPMMHSFLQDLRYALRMMRKNLGSSVAIVLSLAIGIGANTAIFSVIDALLLHPLPYPQPERLAAIWLHSPGLGIFRDWPSPGQYIDLQNENHSFDEMALAQSRNVILLGRDQPERLTSMKTRSSLLSMLGAQARLGHLLLPEDDRPGKAPVAILTDRVWKRLFSSDPNIIGKTITLNGTQYTIVGLLRPGFLLNNEVMPSEAPMDNVDVILPFPLGPDAAQRRGDENYNIMVRLKPGVTVQQAQQDVNAIANRIREKDKRDITFGMHIVGLQEQVVGDVRWVLLVLLGSVAVVLLIACANVANLLLTRAAGRAKEVAIRTALGARWQRLVRQLLTESVLLSLMGGAAGLLIAGWSLHLVHTIKPGNIPRIDEIGISGTVLLFTFGVSLVTGILFGLAPAWRAIKVDLNTTLKAGGRAGQGDSGLRLSRHQLRGLLVVFELAGSLVLLVCAGLLIRSFVRLQNVAPGFSTDHILTLEVAVAGPNYSPRKDAAVVGFYREVENRISRLPGVLSEGEVSSLPLTGTVGWGGINVEGFTPPPGQELQVDLRIASRDYFRAMQIPLIQGRFFEDRDENTAPQVVVIDEKFAQRFWLHESPIGKHLWFDPKKPFTIAGVVGTVKQDSLDSDGKIVVYFSNLQQPSNGMFMVVRSSSNVAALSPAVVREIHSVEPSAPVYNVQTMQDIFYHSLARPRFASTLLGAFAIFALILAAVGVFGVLSYLVSQNTRDIGLRMALGAQPGHIISLVLSQGMKLVGIGIVAGVAGAVALTRVMSSLLFQVRATDALTFGSVAAILAVTALAATVIPVRRAIGIDPNVTLREE